MALSRLGHENGRDGRYRHWSSKDENARFSDQVTRLAGLEPGTRYHFRIHGWDEQGQEVVSEDDSFSTTGWQTPVGDGGLDLRDAGRDADGARGDASPLKGGTGSGCDSRSTVGNNEFPVFGFWFLLSVLCLWLWKPGRKTAG